MYVKITPNLGVLKYKLNKGICTGRRGSNSILGEEEMQQVSLLVSSFNTPNHKTYR